VLVLELSVKCGINTPVNEWYSYDCFMCGISTNRVDKIMEKLIFPALSKMRSKNYFLDKLHIMYHHLKLATEAWYHGIKISEI